MTIKQKERNASRVVISLLEGELKDYNSSYTFRVTDLEISDTGDVSINITINEYGNFVAYMNFKVTNVPDTAISDDDLYKMKISVETCEDCYEEIATYDWTIKHFWIAFMNWPKTSEVK